MRTSISRSGIAAFVLACGAAIAACTTASGEVIGGGLRPGYDPNNVPPAPTAEVRDSGAGTTFKDLYRDFFGPAGVASCSLTPTCHGVMGQAGPKASNFICPKNDINECFNTMRMGKVPGLNLALVEEADIANPDGALMFKVLRQAAVAADPALVPMPLTPADFKFTPAETERIKAWIRNGAKND